MQVIINISDGQKRDSRVTMESGNKINNVSYKTKNGHNVDRFRGVKGSLETNLNALTKDCSLEELSAKLVDGDPEIDLELFGKKIRETHMIYLNNQDQPAYGVRLKEAIFDASGEQKEERNFQIVDSNINLDKPLKWSGRMLPKKEYFNKFVFRNSYQLKHVDGLTYDFLYNMAKELEEKDAFLFLGAGDKSNEPLVLQRNGTAHRAFMEGRTDGESYMLILHLTNLELKSIMGDENA